MKSRPEVSILVPVYGAEHYLSRCIESILAQTFENFELILVNDGSADKSPEICDQYSRIDDRIKVYHRDNHGVSATRNFALQKATGTYTLFVDSDDWIESSMVKTMFEKAITTNSDIVGCNFIEEHKNEKVSIRTYYESHENFVRDVVSSNWGVMWKILVKRSLYMEHSIRFPQNINGGEDYYVCVQLLIHAKNVSCIDESLYHYTRYNSNSLTSIHTLKNTMDQIESTKLVEEFLLDKGIIDKYKKELKIRKFLAKSELVKLNYNQWLSIFPESTSSWKHVPLNWRAKLYYWLAARKQHLALQILAGIKRI